MRGRSITLTVCQGLHKLSILWCTLDVTQLSAPINPLSPLCIPLQHPKLPPRVPGLTGNYWSWHGPSDYDVFYDSLDGSFIVLVAASGFWWWTWWGQCRRRGWWEDGERRGEAEGKRETQRTIEKERDRVMCLRREEFNRYSKAWHHRLASLEGHQALCQ